VGTLVHHHGRRLAEALPLPGMSNPASKHACFLPALRGGPRAPPLRLLAERPSDLEARFSLFTIQEPTPGEAPSEYLVRSGVPVAAVRQALHSFPGLDRLSVPHEVKRRLEHLNFLIQQVSPGTGIAHDDDDDHVDLMRWCVRVCTLGGRRRGWWPCRGGS
jgi:hypothetical protein